MTLSNDVKHASKIKRQFWIFLVGILCSFSPLRALMALQTSINIKDGVGSVSGTIFNLTAMMTSLFLAPIIIRLIGAKKTLILSELLYGGFVVANAVSEFYSIVPGSVLGGMGEGLIWPSISLFNVYYAQSYAEYGSKKVSEYIMDFTGLFFVTLGVTQIVGNLLSFLLLNFSFTRSNTNETLFNNSSFIEPYNNITSDVLPFVQSTVEFCGINDCQDANITLLYKNKYVPASRTKVYILVVLFALLIILSSVIHFCVLPNTHLRISKEEELLPSDGTKSKQVAVKGSSRFIQTLRDTLKQVICKKQLLISPIQFYAGTVVGFVLSEVSRAYVSCIIGVEKVGLAMVSYGISGLFAALLVSKLAGKFGVNVVVILSLCSDMAAYLFCIFWQPGSVSPWLGVFPMTLLGFTGSSWQNLTNALCPIYFHKSRDVAFSIWGANVILGISFPFAWSTLVCVNTKLYTQMALCVFAITLLFIAEWRHGKNKKSLSQCEDEHVDT